MASDDITISLENAGSPGEGQQEENDLDVKDVCETSDPGSSSRKRCLEEETFQYEVIKADQIFEYMTEFIEDVSSIVQVPNVECNL